MELGEREALLHHVMDQFVFQVRKWKASSHCQNHYSDLCTAHKDDICKFYRDSGLQPWEFHTMLHRAAEYGLVEDMQGLWGDVATTFLQLRSSSTADGSMQHPAAHAAANGRTNSKTNSNSSRNSSSLANGMQRTQLSNGHAGPAKPPGLDMSGAPHSSYNSNGLSAAGVQAKQQQRRASDDTSQASSDQHSMRKQQQASSAGWQSQRLANGPANSSSAAQPATSVPAANGYMSSAAYNQQQQPQQQHQRPHGMQHQQLGTGVGPGAAAVTASRQLFGQPGWDLQEPFDLLPSGLLDDVCDQCDAVVDGPAATKAAKSANIPAPAGTAAAAANSGKVPVKQQQQNGGQQQQQPQAGPRLQQSQAGMRKSSLDGTGAPAAVQLAANVSRGGFMPPPQQQQQATDMLGYSANGLHHHAQHSFDGTPSSQQYMLQMRLYQQQQQLAANFYSWGSGHMGYMQGQQLKPAMPPPPPPRIPSIGAPAATTPAAGSAGMGNSRGGSAAAGGAGRPGYAAVTAAGTHSAAESETAPAAAAGQLELAAESMEGFSSSLHGSQTGNVAVRQVNSASGGAFGSGLTSSFNINRQNMQHCSEPAEGGRPLLQQLEGAAASLVGLNATLTAPPPVPVSAAIKGIGSIAPPLSDGLSLFQTASFDSPIVGPLATAPLSPYPSPLHRSLSASTAGASPALQGVGGIMGAGSLGGMAPMLLPPSAAALGAVGDPITGSIGSSSGVSHMAQLSQRLQQQQQQQRDAVVAAPLGQSPHTWSSFDLAIRPAVPGSQKQKQQQAGQPVQTITGSTAPQPAEAAEPASQQLQQQQFDSQQPAAEVQQGLLMNGVGDIGSRSSSSSALGTPMEGGSPSAAGSSSHSSTPAGTANGRSSESISSAAVASAVTPAGSSPARQPPPPPPRQHSGGSSPGSSNSSGHSPEQHQQPKPLTWAQKLAQSSNSSSTANSSNTSKPAASGHVTNGTAAAGPAGPAAAAGVPLPSQGAPHTPQGAWGAGSGSVSNGSSNGPPAAAAAGGTSTNAGPRIAPAPKSDAASQQNGVNGPAGSRGQHRTTGQALLAAAKQQEAAAEAATAAAVPSYSEAAALDGLNEITAKAAVTAASKMPLPAKVIQGWRSGLCLASLIKLLQSQRPDLATAVNDRIRGWLCQDCDRATAECLVLFVLANLRRDWQAAAKNPGAFLMGLLQHRAALIGGSGMARKLLETARNFPNVAVYIDSDVLQELGDMDPALRGFVMDEYMCKQRHDWPEGLKFPSQCLLSCMRSIRYADPAVHKAYMNLMESRPDLAKAMNGVILYGLCKCDAATGLAAVKKLSELPEAWTSAARVNASAFLYQKVQELCGGQGY